ncbi:MAG TPA: LLM class flavin-dependent oxidoreductase [Actinomycetota bacterium]|nr:LLM class flavin-dependent oxidoreductase [Actinomycetota bacterium]
MRVGYGLITCQRPPDDTRSDADLYEEMVERCVTAERAGFDSVWVSEHHFLDDGYMPSLLVACAAIAQATERVEIGTGVLLAPLHDPIRIAEDAATVDLISRGRLILGIGAGWRSEEFDVFGVEQRERAARMRETVRVLRGAWGPGTFEHDGHPVNVTPKPAHPIPIWLGGFSEPAIRRAGRIADGFLGSSTGTSGIEAFARAQAIALQARTDPSPFTFALHVPVFASESGDPWEMVKSSYHYLRWKYPDMGAARASAQAKSPPPLDPATEEQLRASIICGRPDEVAAEIARFRDALGDDIHFICRSDFPGMPRELQLETIETLGARVIPSLR